MALKLTCLPIVESEDFLQNDMIRTFAENRDVHIAAACVDATFDSAFDAAHCTIVGVQVAFARNTDFALLASPDDSVDNTQIVD